MFRCGCQQGRSELDNVVFLYAWLKQNGKRVIDTTLNSNETDLGVWKGDPSVIRHGLGKFFSWTPQSVFKLRALVLWLCAAARSDSFPISYSHSHDWFPVNSLRSAVLTEAGSPLGPVSWASSPFIWSFDAALFDLSTHLIFQLPEGFTNKKRVYIKPVGFFIKQWGKGILLELDEAWVSSP